jgi:hypothetical protein
MRDTYFAQLFVLGVISIPLNKNLKSPSEGRTNKNIVQW